MAVNLYTVVLLKMKIAETDIAILIPTFNSAAFIERCLKSAISSGAGEIIISDDCSSDETENIIMKFKDERIKFYKNINRLGLWENHLQLLKLSTKPWIKFLQADDYLDNNGLQKFCDNDVENLSIVSALSVNENYETKKRTVTFKLLRKRRWNSNDYLMRVKIVGNELGTPSNTLIKKENIIIDMEYWKTNTSADLLINIIAASKGDVVLLPAGPIIRGIHNDQDTNKQNFRLFIDRLQNSVNILLRLRNITITEFANIFLFVESFGIIRMIIGQILRGKISTSKYFIDIIKNLKILDFSILVKNIIFVKKMFQWKYGKRELFNLDF